MAISFRCSVESPSSNVFQLLVNYSDPSSIPNLKLTLKNFTRIYNPFSILDLIMTGRPVPSRLAIDQADRNGVGIYLIYRWYRLRSDTQLVLVTSEPLPSIIYETDIPIIGLTPFDRSRVTTIRYHSKNYSLEDPILIDDLITLISDFLRTVGDQGNILVFVAGRPEIDTLIQRWNEDEVPPTDLEGFLRDNPKSGRVLLITSMAEVNDLPIGSNLIVVIDTLVHRGTGITPSGAILTELQYVTQSQANIRAELAPIAYRMGTFNFVERLPTRSPDDLRLYPRDRLNYFLGAMGIEGSTSIDPKNSILRYPLSLQNGKVLTDWLATGQPIFPCLSVLCLIDCFSYNLPENPFTYPLANDSVSSSAEYQQILSETAEAYFNSMMGRSDLDTLLNIWVRFLDETGGFDSSLTQTLRWSKNYRISLPYLRRVKTLIKQMIELLAPSVDSEQLEIGPFTVRGILDPLRPLLGKRYPIFNLISDPLTQSNPIYRSDDGRYYHLTPYINRSQLLAQPPSRLIALSTTEIQETRYIGIGLDFD